jgi:hypothetical protein
MTIDASGNVGIGVVPSIIWSSSYDALQIGLGGSMYAHAAAGSNMHMAANSVYEGTAPNYYDKYLTSSTASKYVQDSGLHIWSTAASGTAGDAITWSEAMRIDASGNVGIGTSSPSTYGKLVVDDGKISLVTDTASSRRISFWSTLNGNSENAYIQSQNDGGTTNTGEILFATKNAGGTLAERMRIDASGNVGIGVVPTTDHNPVVEALQIGSTANLFGRNDAEIATLTSNSYLSLAGYPKYITTNEASEYIQTSGNHIWYNAPSGTAGTSCTQTERMRIDSSGTLVLKGPDDNSLQFYESGSEMARIGPNGGDLRFLVGSTTTPSMTIDSSGNVGIGVTPSAWAGVTGLQLSTGCSLNGSSVNAVLGANSYYDGTNWKYIVSTFSTNYYSNYANNGSHVWQIAPSGTAGDTITYTNAMTLDASGNVGIGGAPSSTIRNDSSSAEKALQIGTRAMFFSDGGVTTDLQNNSHLNNADIRVAMATDLGSLYQQYQGIHKWSNAASVSAGAAQTMSERMRIDASGNVLVGKTNTAFGTAGVELRSNGGVWSTVDGAGSDFNRLGIDGAVQTFWKAGVSVGSISVTGSATAYNTSSDYRLKTDAQPMTGASARVQALNPVNFEWISTGERVDGFLAHEAQEVVPEAVTGTKDAMRDEEYEVTPAVLDDEGNVVTEAVMGTRSVPDMQGIDQSKLVPLLTAALQEALTKIDALETRITALEG